ncbi:hypothetical protein A3I57_03525 [Candidatus Beckwithbacteria bacterium RIFCSPLOWO2_02_FULL_47_23]|uniref:Uncharacterized protein n=2 Tax=Candidatus Beckwithiibacteriota TaxID=1752726 RepID=A0A1F5E313_9BACT|nr:MAG: hypothetical protein A3E73_03020 [Candidatus Beckwithbacteria bacterium RIFCSPHIGHO2_12_FULL_47_17]OGD61817.1 MAG: hypothetical protein A3I57_03525 [Candidatus Beckwithbacteria bacterium RIFCSPLOWO2_02_FULL_47_23]
MIAFYQALGVIGYCSLIAIVFWRGEAWFGHVPNFFGPLLMLSILTTSALICGLLVFAYPVKLYLKTKKADQPIKLVLMTAAWMIVFSLLVMLGIGVSKNLI